MLTDEDVEDILIASGHNCKQRKRKLCDLSVTYANSLKKRAQIVLNGWMDNGVPLKSWITINKKPIVKTYGLNVISSTTSLSTHNNAGCHPGPDQPEQVHYFENPVTNTSQNNTEPDNAEDRMLNNAEQTDNMSNLENSFNNFGVEQDHDKTLPLPKLTLIELLQHFATYTNQTQDAMTYLLFLLKVYRPSAAYEMLPNTGKILLDLKGCNWNAQNGESSEKLPPAIPIKGGSYFHFGLKDGLLADSPGVVHSTSALLQYVDVYLEDPNLLPKPVSKKIEAYDTALLVDRAKNNLRGGSTSAPADETSSAQKPHIVYDLFVDGVNPFQSAGSSKLIPILARAHSIQSDYKSNDGIRILKDTTPFIVGFYSGKHKPDDPDELMKSTIDEMIALHPESEDSQQLPFTACCRCCMCDSPMRSFLKQTKGHSGFWCCDRCIQEGTRIRNIISYTNANAPLRLDEDFLKYHVNDFSKDEHMNPSKISPFVRCDFPMVTGFPIDPLHTMIDGAFGRRIEGFASIPLEDKLSPPLLAVVDQRVKIFKLFKTKEFDRAVETSGSWAGMKMHVKRQFLYYHLFPVFEGILDKHTLEHIMHLQYAMLLMGSFDPAPVPKAKLDLARKILKLYSVELEERNISARFMSHLIIHLPNDSELFQCGIETLAVWLYESFLVWFQQILGSGNLPAEQIRNRLLEKCRYELPTTSSGHLIQNSVQLKLEARRKSPRNKSPVELYCRGEKWPKKLIFPNFELSNKAPNNFCSLVDGSIVLCSDFFYGEDGCLKIVGRKFENLTDAFSSPYCSSEYGTFLAWNLSPSPAIYNSNDITAKIYAFPKLPAKLTPSNDSKTIDDFIKDKTQSWILIPIRHTIRK